MAPKKPSTSSSVSAGAGMSTRSITKNRVTTQQQPTTTRSKSKVQASTTTQTPVKQSARSGKTTRIHKSSPNKSTSKKAKGNEASRRRQASALDMISSSSPVASSSDVEVGPSTQPKVTASHAAASEPVHPKVAAFQEARGLSFEQLYVESDDFASSSDIAPDSSTVPQKTSGTAAKATDAVAASKRPKRTLTKRSLDSDDSQDAAGAESSSPAPTAKRLKLTVKKPTTPASSKKPITPVSNKKRASDNNDDAPPAKRIGITVDDPAAEVEDASTDSAPDATTPVPAAIDATASGNSKAKSKGAPVITKNGKVKKTPEYAVEHDFEGTASGHGTSLESPEFGTLDKPWFCANLNCSTGMTWVPRDHKDSKSGKGPMGRKVISQFFGRNKGPTKLIPNDVWHFYCRKDYQRGRYAAEHGTVHELAKYVIQNLRDQLIRLKLWRPDALFQVQLDKGATDRLNAYFAALRQHNNNEAAALASLPGPKDAKKEKPEEVFPPSLSETFNRRFKTAGKAATADYDDIEAIIAWSEAEIAAGRSKVFVPCEFLINPPQPGETEKDITNNFAQWEVIYHDRMRAEAEAAAAAAASEDSASGTSASGDSPSDEAASQEIKSSPVPSTKKVSKGKGKATIIKPDPDETEPNSDADDEPETPTSAPRTSYNIQADPNDPMSLMRILNNVAEDMGYHARNDRS